MTGTRKKQTKLNQKKAGRKEIIEIKVEINRIESRKLMETIKKIKLFLKEIKSINLQAD